MKPHKKERLSAQITLTNQIIQLIRQYTGDDSFAEDLVDLQGEQLLALLPEQNNIRVLRPREGMPRPETSLIEISLFTGAQSEPSMFNLLLQFTVEFMIYCSLYNFILSKMTEMFTYRSKRL